MSLELLKASKSDRHSCYILNSKGHSYQFIVTVKHNGKRIFHYAEAIHVWPFRLRTMAVKNIIYSELFYVLVLVLYFVNYPFGV